MIHRNESRWPPLPPVIKIAMQSKMEIGRKNRTFYVFSSLNLSYYCVEDNVLKPQLISSYLLTCSRRRIYAMFFEIGNSKSFIKGT